MPSDEDIAAGDEVTTTQIDELSMVVVSEARIVVDESDEPVVLEVAVVNTYTLEPGLLCVFPLARGLFRTEARAREPGRPTGSCS